MQKEYPRMMYRKQPNPEEYEIFIQYLTGRKPAGGLQNIYTLASQSLPLSSSFKEKNLLKVCLAKPWLLPFIDAYLGYRYPQHLIRKKIFIILALLETHPGFANYFLPEKASFIKLLMIGIRLIWSAIKIGIGRILYGLYN